MYTETEVALANRNKGMPLEMLRYDITPVGMHYLLTHFDMPHVDVDTFRLEIGGLVDRPTRLTLDELRSAGSQTLAVTLECAGNGRTHLSPRAFNMPWGLEAVSTAEWTGVPLRDVIGRGGVKPEAVELVFSGPDEGTQGGVRHSYQRSLTRGEIERPEVMLVWDMNGRPLEPQHGAPLRLIVPGWYGMASVKWLRSIEAVPEPFLGVQQASSYAIRKQPDDDGVPITRMRVRALMTPPGRPGLPHARACRGCRSDHSPRPSMVGRSADRQGRGRRGWPVVRGSTPGAGQCFRVAGLVDRLGCDAG